jgi:Outer membrane protein transport protein (OMPP1/FadL/TodX)
MSTYISKKIIILSCIIVINSSFILAQNVNDVLRVAIPGLGSDARALGMGNSYIALSDDGSASFFNPAGFGLLKRLEFTGGLSYAGFNNNVNFFNNNTSYSNSNTKLNQLTFAFPFPTLQGSLVFALSYHTTKDLTGAVKFDGFNNGNNSLIQDFLNTDIPYDLYLTDLNNNTPISGNLNQSGSILNSGSINNWTFSGAIEVYKNLFIGANLNIISGNFTSNNDYYEDDTKNIYQGRTDPTDSTTIDFRTFHLNRILDWDISGWNAKFGFLYQLENNARFGLTVQFPKTYDIKEKFTVNGSSEFGSGFTYDLNSDKYSDNVEYEITTPFELGAGFSVNYVGLIFSAQATIIDYSQTDLKNVDGLSEQYAQNLNKDIKDQLKSVFNYNLGVEYNVPGLGLRLRGGYFVQPSPYQGDPSEFNRKYLTAGIGFLTNETVGLDFAYAYGWWKDFGDNYGSNVSRTFQDVTTNQFIMTGTYRF